MRILLVEDYGPLRQSLAQGLREAGFAVDVSADGEEGLWYARSNAYDAIVLDLMLPKLDGLARMVRRTRATLSSCSRQPEDAKSVLVLDGRSIRGQNTGQCRLGAK